jgi:hypothetical protein
MAVKAADFGKLFPRPEDLQTGDLLYPRALDTTNLFEWAHKTAPFRFEQLKKRYGGHTLRELQQEISDRQSYREISSMGKGAWMQPPPSVPASVLEQQYSQLSAEDHEESLLQADMRYFMLLKEVFRVEFEQLIPEWLGLTVSEFFAHPIVRVILKSLNEDTRDGLFVGHVGLVLRMDEFGRHCGPDSGEVYVIEANATDFSRYGVSYHPYYLVGDDSGALAQRAWLNFRQALNPAQAIWHARLKKPAIGDTAKHAAWCQQIIDQSLAKLNKLYSILDDHRMGDGGRYYCNEFCYRVIQDACAAVGANVVVDDRRTWQWFRDNLEPGQFTTQVTAALDAQSGKIWNAVKDRRFFLLTTAMLYWSQQLDHLLKPSSEDYAYRKQP